MGRSGAQRRLVAGLAFVAIWLTIVAPVVSRVLPAVSVAPAASDMACAEHMGNAPDPAKHPNPPTTDKCGYCNLIGHSPVLVRMAWVATLLPQASCLPSQLPDEWYVRGHSLIAPTPRGPPRFVNA